MAGKIYTIVIFWIFCFSVSFTSAQIILKPDPGVEFDHSKGIIAIVPSSQGTFYLDNYMLTEIKGNDTIYIINVTPGIYIAGFNNQGALMTEKIIVDRHNVLAIIPGTDSLRINKNSLKWYPTTEKIAGKPVFFLLSNYAYTIIEMSTFSYQWAHPFHSNRTAIFNSFTAITGYQVSRGFAVGAGVSFSSYDIASSHYSYGKGELLENILFLPAFLDLRFNLSDKRVVPYFNFDIGYSFLLSPKYYEYATIKRGGFHFSAGLGLRVAISKLVQVIPSFEYCMDRGKIGSYSSTDYEAFSINVFRFKIGVGLQYR